MAGPKKVNTQPTKVERTGDTTFAVKHDDGSVFEGKIDPTKINPNSVRFHRERLRGKTVAYIQDGKYIRIEE